MPYIILFTVLSIFIVLVLTFQWILGDEKKQYYIAGLFLCYGLCTKAKMSMDSTVSDLKYNLRRGVDSDGYISNSDFRVEDYGDSVSVQIRYLGKWKNPSHARYEEDYDWQELKSSSGKQIDKVIKKLSKQSGRKITWGASEKNWIDIDIPKMKGD